LRFIQQQQAPRRRNDIGADPDKAAAFREIKGNGVIWQLAFDRGSSLSPT